MQVRGERLVRDRWVQKRKNLAELNLDALHRLGEVVP